MVGGIPITGKSVGAFCNLLRQSCDARRSKPLPIEIIAKRKVALPLSRIELRQGYW
jgi:hypothetical protein